MHWSPRRTTVINVSKARSNDSEIRVTAIDFDHGHYTASCSVGGKRFTAKLRRINHSVVVGLGGLGGAPRGPSTWLDAAGNELLRDANGRIPWDAATAIERGAKALLREMESRSPMARRWGSFW